MDDEIYEGVFIPHTIWTDKRMTAADKVVWAAIAHLSDKDVGGCHAPNCEIAEFCGLPVNDVAEAIARIDANGYFERVSFGGGVRTIVLRR